MLLYIYMLPGSKCSSRPKSHCPTASCEGGGETPISSAMARRWYNGLGPIERLHPPLCSSKVQIFISLARSSANPVEGIRFGTTLSKVSSKDNRFCSTSLTIEAAVNGLLTLAMRNKTGGQNRLHYYTVYRIYHSCTPIASRHYKPAIYHKCCAHSGRRKQDAPKTYFCFEYGPTARDPAP